MHKDYIFIISYVPVLYWYPNNDMAECGFQQGNNSLTPNNEKFDLGDQNTFFRE